MTPADRARLVDDAFTDTIAAHTRVWQDCAGRVIAAADAVTAALRAGRKVLVCGNGGSAADSQHFVAELVGRFTRERRAWPALALSADTCILTAVGNDYGFERVFARQVEAHGQPGDVLIGISTSGNSADVVKAFEQAEAQGLHRIALTGETGGALAPMADVAIRVPSPETSHIQECHIAIGQLLAFMVEETLYPEA